MPEIIDIPGVGPVEFPDSMSDGDKTAAARRLHTEAVTEGRKQRVLPQTPAPAASDTDPYGANILTQAIGAGRGVIGGIGQGVMSNATGLAELAQGAARNHPLLSRVLPEAAFGEVRTPDVQALTTPYSTPAKVGKAVEQVAEFAIPGGMAAKATARIPAIMSAGRGIQAAAHAGTQAAVAGAVGATQEGKVSAGIAPAVIPGAMPVIGAGLRKGAEVIVRGRLPQNLEALGVKFPFDRRPLTNPRPESALKREHWVRDEATGDVLNAGLRGNRKDVARIENLLGDVSDVTAVERAYFEQLSRILSTKQHTPLQDLAANVVTGGATAPASIIRRFPTHTAQNLDWLAGYSTPAAGAAAGTLSPALSPVVEAMFQELLARDVAMDGER